MVAEVQLPGRLRDEFFGGYGIAPDQDRMDHYLRQWEDGD
jgi:hypothetical protein